MHHTLRVHHHQKGKATEDKAKLFLHVRFVDFVWGGIEDEHFFCFFPDKEKKFELYKGIFVATDMPHLNIPILISESTLDLCTNQQRRDTQPQ
jgi:hypothetical protein